MSDKLFTRLLIAVLAVCLIATAAHLVYAIDAYQHCSIIYFIGKELW
ncbi:MAG: hypothetical protein IJZ08_08695 [Clostridia bacterium]|nr:hypothetical protein [Clostridia bacterium]